MIVFALLSKSKLVSFKLLIEKSTSVQHGAIESFWIVMELGLLKNSKIKEIRLVWEFLLNFSLLYCQGLGINPAGIQRPSKSHVEGGIKTIYGLWLAD